MLIKSNRWLFVAPAVAVGIVIFGLIGYGYAQIILLQTKTDQLTGELASTTDALTKLRDQASGLSSNLNSAQQAIQSTQTQVGGFAQTVTTLEKLSQTDPELLKKYSKIYFLNENYRPAELSVINQKYVYSRTHPEQFFSPVLPDLNGLMIAAQEAGVTLYIKSAYRSFDEQKSLKSDYSVTYGAGTANQFSADQGYSEHQLGTAVDFITTGLSGNLTASFAKTSAYLWLQGNAYKYGFILSYPANNSYYIFEPWHWRYVGVKLATDLHQQNKNFYDLGQREIDPYLVNFFD